MSLEYADVLPRVRWAEAASKAEYIKNYLPHSTYQLKKSLFEVIFDNKPLIKYLYNF
jgi:hypothetical protein